MALVIASAEANTKRPQRSGRVSHGRSPRLSAQKDANAKPSTIDACWEYDVSWSSQNFISRHCRLAS